MDKTFSGKVWKLPDDVDTDSIIAVRYCIIVKKAEMAKHCLESLRPDFTANVKPGDIIVGGKNFGCGSSREQAAEALKESGITCIIAKSFARIFFRNAINNGMLLIESDVIPDQVAENDVLTVNVGQSVVVNGQTYAISKLPDYLMDIINDGGLVPNTIKRMQALEGGE